MLQRQRQKLNKAIGNRGFSLVELLVVVAIMGIMVGVASLSYVVVSKSNVKKTAGFIADAIYIIQPVNIRLKRIREEGTAVERNPIT